MCASTDQIITVELAWLLVGAVVWMLLYRPGSGQSALGVFMAGVGTVMAWPVVVVAIAAAFAKGRVPR